MKVLRVFRYLDAGVHVLVGLCCFLCVHAGACAAGDLQLHLGLHDVAQVVTSKAGQARAGEEDEDEVGDLGHHQALSMSANVCLR